MPKRPNPFQDEISLPFKTYVRQKEVDLGVNRAENMKLVYDKTLKLLFNGASTLSKTENGISNGYHQKAVANGHTHQNGHATTNGKLNGDSNIIQKRNTCCRSNVNYKCSFCEKCICSTCQQVCVKCEEIFCSICSILQYRERDEIALCLLCINDA